MTRKEEAKEVTPKEGKGVARVVEIGEKHGPKFYGLHVAGVKVKTFMKAGAAYNRAKEINAALMPLLQDERDRALEDCTKAVCDAEHLVNCSEKGCEARCPVANPAWAIEKLKSPPSVLGEQRSTAAEAEK